MEEGGNTALYVGYTVDAVDTFFTVDIVNLTRLTLLTLKSLCRGLMDEKDGSYPLDCYDCHEYSSCTT